jgi:hypothetical protein
MENRSFEDSSTRRLLLHRRERVHRLNLFDRPYFPSLMAGQSVLGTLVISRSTGKRSVIIAEPVRVASLVIGAVETRQIWARTV